MKKTFKFFEVKKNSVKSIFKIIILLPYIKIKDESLKRKHVDTLLEVNEIQHYMNYEKESLTFPLLPDLKLKQKIL